MITAADLSNRQAGQRERRRGRRPAVPTVVAHVRIPEPVYDHYCRLSLTEDASLNAVLQRALIVQSRAGQ